METGETESLIRVWQNIMAVSGRSWVLFRRGTCVVLDGEPSELAARAKDLLREWGPVQVATPSADFDVHKPPAGQGWLVTSHHPDISTYVSQGEFGDQRVADILVGLRGRAKRDQDAQELDVIYASPRLPL